MQECTNFYKELLGALSTMFIKFGYIYIYYFVVCFSC